MNDRSGTDHRSEGTPPEPSTSTGAGGAGPAGGRREAVTRGVRLVAVLAALVVAGIVVATTVVLTGPPSEQDLMEGAGLVGKRELLIGVKDDQPGIALRDPDTGAFSGFDIDIALMIAADLGFRPNAVRFFAIESEDRAKMLASTDEGQFVTVDLVIATYSVTDERERGEGVTFSAPYLSTEQSVVTRIDYQGSVDTLQDLRDQRVCSLSTATSESAVVQAGVDLTSKKKISECVSELLDGDVDAVTTDAAILAGFVAQHPLRLRHHDIGLEIAESWGVNTGGNEALRDLRTADQPGLGAAAGAARGRVAGHAALGQRTRAVRSRTVPAGPGDDPDPRLGARRCGPAGGHHLATAFPARPADDLAGTAWPVHPPTHGADRLRVRLACLALPLLAYAWLTPGISAALGSGEIVAVLLFTLPPLLAVGLTGPVPRWAALPLTRWVVLAAAVTAPFVLGAIFLRAPILPAVAVEVTAEPASASAEDPAEGAPASVFLLGRVINVDDRTTTLIETDGTVRFVPNDRVRSQVLCPETEQVPYSTVRVRGWQVEETALEWAMPRRPPQDPDPRCLGRPSGPSGS